MNIKDVIDVLGGRKVLMDISTELDLADAVHAGLPAAAIDAVHAALAPDQPLAFVVRLVGAERTIARKRPRLSDNESDKLARVARVLVRATEALGDRQRARLWLLRPNNRALGGRTAVTLLTTDAGTAAVENALARLEHGVFI